jgi:hypothetical protein
MPSSDLAKVLEDAQEESAQRGGRDVFVYRRPEKDGLYGHTLERKPNGSGYEFICRFSKGRFFCTEGAPGQFDSSSWETELGGEVVIPVVHLGGDTKQRLIEQLLAMSESIGRTLAVFAENQPNVRNYYPVGSLWGKAQAQHHQRRTMLIAVKESVDAELEKLSDGKGVI